jgi:hypothetical protein
VVAPGPDRRAAPVDVRVQVDQAGCHHLSAQFAHLGSGAGREPVADGGHPAGAEMHVGDAVEVLGRVNHARTAQDQVVGPVRGAP